jgi:membrane protein DedA with SNARE-associated domain
MAIDPRIRCAMSIEELVTQYGYMTVFVGSLLEGETVLLLAGLAVHEGLLSFPLVVALAFVGGTLGDQLLFRLGRRYGIRLLRRSPSLAARIDRLDSLIERHQTPLIIGVRFMYGLRLVGPYVIGASKVSASRFALLNLIGAAIWAPLIVSLGYLFGQTLRWLIDDLGHYEALALLGVGALFGLAWIGRAWDRRRRGRREQQP